MKKNVLSAFLILFLTTGYTQTIKNDSKKIDWEWAPVGAVWMYQGYNKKWYIKSLKDTLYNGHDCKKLKVEQYNTDEYGNYSLDNVRYKYTYNVNGKIYIYKDNINEFRIIYNYNVIPGDTVQLNVPFDGCNEFNQYVVDSIINRFPGQWMFNYETNTPIISYHLIPNGVNSECSIMYCGYDEGTYLSYAGVTRMYSIINDEDYYNFRCYYDGNIEIQKSSYIDSCKLYYQDNLNISKKDNNVKIKVYPNPVDKNLNIKIDQPKGDLLKIFDGTGRIIYHNYVYSEKYSVDFTGFPSGLYYVTINNNDKLYKKKIIKTKNE